MTIETMERPRPSGADSKAAGLAVQALQTAHLTYCPAALAKSAGQLLQLAPAIAAAGTVADIDAGMNLIHQVETCAGQLPDLPSRVAAAALPIARSAEKLNDVYAVDIKCEKVARGSPDAAARHEIFGLRLSAGRQAAAKRDFFQSEQLLTQAAGQVVQGSAQGEQVARAAATAAMMAHHPLVAHARGHPATAGLLALVRQTSAPGSRLSAAVEVEPAYLVYSGDAPVRLGHSSAVHWQAATDLDQIMNRVKVALREPAGVTKTRTPRP